MSELRIETVAKRDDAVLSRSGTWRISRVSILPGASRWESAV